MTLPASSVLNVGLHANTQVIADGTSILVIDTGNDASAITTALGDGRIVLVDSGMIDLQNNVSTLSDLIIKVVYLSTPAGATGNAAAALTPALTATAGDAAAFAAIASLTTAQTASAGIQLAPAPAGVSAVAGATGSVVLNTVSGRLASVRSGGSYAGREQTGFSSGGEGMSNAVWIRPFTNHADQGLRDKIDGYNAATYGVAGGVDRMFGDNFRLGLSFSYANTDVDGDSVAKNKTDVNSYQVAVYGDYTFPNFYLEGMAGYAYNDVDTSRVINFGGLNRIASGSYSADQYMARIGAGVPLKVTGTPHVFTPNAAVQYTRVASDSYTETGAGALNLRVVPEDIDIALLMAGVKYNGTFKATGGGTLRPEIRLALLYDAVGDEAVSTSTFTGGGAAFKTTGADVAQLGGAAGVGLTYSTPDKRWDFSVDYDGEMREDFIAHSGKLEARFKF